MAQKEYTTVEVAERLGCSLNVAVSLIQALGAMRLVKCVGQAEGIDRFQFDPEAPDKVAALLRRL